MITEHLRPSSVRENNIHIETTTVQTKAGSSNNAWIDYMKVCAQNYKEGKELTTTAKGKAAATKPPRKDEKEKGAKLKQETEENRKTALQREHDMKELKKKRHQAVAKKI